MADVKFCGLTRATDCALAVELDAAYVGVIFAGGPRLLGVARAKEVLAPAVGTRTRRVGVFGAQSSEEIRDIANELSLDVLQLSYGASRASVIGLRSIIAAALWPVLHLRPEAPLDDAQATIFRGVGVDAVVLDAAVAGQLGGTGVALDWAALAPVVRQLQAESTVVLAGGLKPSNVAAAVAMSGASVVDVSSGVEVSPGIKDPDLMRAFAEAARGTR